MKRPACAPAGKTPAYRVIRGSKETPSAKAPVRDLIRAHAGQVRSTTAYGRARRHTQKFLQPLWP